MERTLFMHSDSVNFYMVKIKGKDLDLYKCQVGKGPVMILACPCTVDDLIDPDGTSIIMRHLPIEHVPPLTYHNNKNVREAAYARLAGR